VLLVLKLCGGETGTSSKKPASVSTEVGKFLSGVVQQIGMAIKSPNGPASPALIADQSVNTSVNGRP